MLAVELSLERCWSVDRYISTATCKRLPWGDTCEHLGRLGEASSVPPPLFTQPSCQDFWTQGFVVMNDHIT